MDYHCSYSPQAPLHPQPHRRLPGPCIVVEEGWQGRQAGRVSKGEQVVELADRSRCALLLQERRLWEWKGARCIVISACISGLPAPAPHAI